MIAEQVAGWILVTPRRKTSHGADVFDEAAPLHEWWPLLGDQQLFNSARSCKDKKASNVRVYSTVASVHRTRCLPSRYLPDGIGWMLVVPPSKPKERGAPIQQWQLVDVFDRGSECSSGLGALGEEATPPGAPHPGGTLARCVPAAEFLPRDQRPVEEPHWSNAFMPPLPSQEMPPSGSGRRGSVSDAATQQGESADPDTRHSEVSAYKTGVYKVAKEVLAMSGDLGYLISERFYEFEKHRPAFSKQCGEGKRWNERCIGIDARDDDPACSKQLRAFNRWKWCASGKILEELSGRLQKLREQWRKMTVPAEYARFHSEYQHVLDLYHDAAMYSGKKFDARLKGTRAPALFERSTTAWTGAGHWWLGAALTWKDLTGEDFPARY